MQEDGQFACRKALNLAYIDQNRSKKWRVFNNFFPYEDIAENLYKTIKYKHRNGKLTRKYKKYLRLMRI